MKKLLIITADRNDGDYLTEECYISEKTVEWFKKISTIIKKHNGEWGDTEEMVDVYKELSENDLDTLSEYIPVNSENCERCHTIESIKILHVEKEEVFV